MLILPVFGTLHVAEIAIITVPANASSAAVVAYRFGSLMR